MSFVNIVKNRTVWVDKTYRDRADLMVWSGYLNEKYGWTPRNWGGTSVTTGSFGRTTTQPTDWNYRARIRAHENATTYLDGTELRFVEYGNRGMLQVTYDGWYDLNKWRPMYWEATGMIVPIRYWPAAPSIPTTEADRLARMRLMKMIRKSYESFQGLTFLGELRETVQMLRRPLSSLREGFSDYLRTVKKRANRSKGHNSLSNMVAGTWLEYVFGWAPLISDIGNAQEALETVLNRYEDSYERFSAKGEYEIPYGTYTYFSDLQRNPWIVDQRMRMMSKAIVRYYGQVFRAALTGQTFNRSNLGLTLSNFVPTVWELIPYSFLVDYFANAGDLIEAATTNTSGVKWITSDTIQLNRSEWSIYRIRRNTNAQPDNTVRNVRTVFERTTSLIENRKVVRNPLAAPPTVGLSDFQFKVPLTGRKWANMSALAAQQSDVLRFLKRRM